MHNYLIPIIVSIILIYGIYKKVPIFDTFIEGVKEGLTCVFNLFPTLFSMVIAINILTSSNLIFSIVNKFDFLFNRVSYPASVIPLAILRPISSSASLSYLEKIFSLYGVDSFTGKLASVMQGSTDTTIYIIGLYYSSVGVNKIRYSLVLGLLSDLVSVIVSFIVVKSLF